MVVKYLLAFLLLFSSFVVSAGSTIKVLDSDDQQVYLFTGDIVSGDTQEFNRVILDTMDFNRPRFLILNSNGGEVVEATGFGERIRGLGFDTIITPTTKCNSACGFLFLAGNTCYVYGDAHLGVHSPGSPNVKNIEDKFVFASAALYVYFVEKMGRSQVFTFATLTTPNESPRYLTDSELKELGCKFKKEGLTSG